MPVYDPVPMAEVLARLSLSFALTPDTGLPLDDQQSHRAICAPTSCLRWAFRPPPPTTRRSRRWVPSPKPTKE